MIRLKLPQTPKGFNYIHTFDCFTLKHFKTSSTGSGGKKCHRIIQMHMEVVSEMSGDSKQLCSIYSPLTVFIRIINYLPLGLLVSMTV